MSSKDPTFSKEEYIAKLTNGVPDHADPALKTYWMITRVLVMAILLFLAEIPFIALFFFVDDIGMSPWLVWFLVILMTFLIIFIVVSILFINLEYKHYTFNIQKKSLTINRGILHKTSIMIPYNRVQSVTFFNGPLMRWLGISTVIITTAGYAGLLGGQIQGVKEPEIVRDVILQRVQSIRNAVDDNDVGL